MEGKVDQAGEEASDPEIEGIKTHTNEASEVKGDKSKLESSIKVSDQWSKLFQLKSAMTRSKTDRKKLKIKYLCINEKKVGKVKKVRVGRQLLLDGYCITDHSSHTRPRQPSEKRIYQPRQSQVSSL